MPARFVQLPAARVDIFGRPGFSFKHDMQQAYINTEASETGMKEAAGIGENEFSKMIKED